MATIGYSIQIGADTKYKEEIIKMLLKKGLDYKVKDCDGRSAYQNAVEQHPFMHLLFKPYMTREDKQYFKK